MPPFLLLVAVKSLGVTHSCNHLSEIEIKEVQRGGKEIHRHLPSAFLPSGCSGPLKKEPLLTTLPSCRCQMPHVSCLESITEKQVFQTGISVGQRVYLQVAISLGSKAFLT